MEIKFRKKDLVKAMRRIDETSRKLVEQLGKRLPKTAPQRAGEAAGSSRAASSPAEIRWTDAKHSDNHCEIF